MAQATGYLNLLPEQFWQLTPREFENMIAGFRMREDLEWQRTAQLAAWIRQAHGDKKVTADKLLGKDKRKERTSGKVVSIEEKRRTLDELEQSLGKAGDIR